MPSFRVLNPFPTYVDFANKPADGGELRFYEAGTTTPKSVFADPGLTIDNGPVVGIGSDGRTVVDVWGDGAYRVRLYDADSTLIAEADNVEIPGGAGLNIPVPSVGEFVTGDGTQFLLQTLLLLPDPTGQDGKMVVADGAGYILVPQPTDPTPVDPEIVVTDASFQAGVSTDETKWFVQTGSGSATAGGSKTATASIVFDTPYAVAPKHVAISPTTASSTGAANLVPAWAITAKSVTGFTVTFSTVTGGTSADNQAPSNIISAVTFDWMATGTIEVPAP
jgi:hypothetical protein